MTICKICNKDCKSTRSLSYHIKNIHNITLESYYRKFYLQPGEDICENCGKQLQFIKLTKPFGKTCSKKCFGQNSLTKERRNETNLEKYGVKNPFESSIIKDQIRTNIIKNYGGFGLGSSIIKDKIIDTNLYKYGVDNPWKNEKVIQEIKQNRLNRIEQFEKDNDCTEKQKLIDLYGASWLSIENTLDSIWLDNNHKFIKNYEISKIESLGPKFCRHALNDLEIEIFDYIRSIYYNTIRQNDRQILDGKELDLYFPELNLGIEIDGDYWHSDIFKENAFHYNKSNLCKSKGIRLIHIQEYMWKTNKAKYKNYLRQVIKNQDYFEIESQNNEFISLDYNFGLPSQINGYEIYKFTGPIKLKIDNYNVYGCGNVIYKLIL